MRVRGTAKVDIGSDWFGGKGKVVGWCGGAVGFEVIGRPAREHVPHRGEESASVALWLTCPSPRFPDVAVSTPVGLEWSSEHGLHCEVWVDSVFPGYEHPTFCLCVDRKFHVWELGKGYEIE